MKVDPVAAGSRALQTQPRQSRRNAQAHGLVRQLREDTFNGASLEKHLARFADRLGDSQTDPVEGHSTPVDAPVDGGSTIPAEEDAVSAPTADDANAAGHLVQPISASSADDVSEQDAPAYSVEPILFYDGLAERHPFSVSGLRGDWLV